MQIGQVSKVVSQLLYMDDIKLYAKHRNQLKPMINVAQITASAIHRAWSLVFRSAPRFMYTGECLSQVMRSLSKHCWVWLYPPCKKITCTNTSDSLNRLRCRMVR